MQIYICINCFDDEFMTDVTMKITSRQRILELVQQHKKITTSELNLYLNMTPANIRYHLSVLVTDGLLEISENRKIERGRPQKVYSLIKSYSDYGLAIIMETLLNLIKKDSGMQELSILIGRIAENWAEKYRDQKINISPKLLLTNSIEKLNDLKYQAQWEAGKEGPTIRFDNCPYFRIIKEFPILCEMDRTLLEKMVDLKFYQTMKLEKDIKGLTHCAFIGTQERILYPE